jgi:hydrogenase maturation protein HypF
MMSLADSNVQRLKGVVRGAVQGVGFRPFVYRLATELGLAGWVLNSAQGVFIEVEGERGALDQFRLRLETGKPPRAVLQSVEFSLLDPAGHVGFEIRRSDDHGAKTTLILPDIATCADCLREISDPANRRHRYPFTNCTNCGPRFSIIEALPYDRPNTSMKGFTMCPDCLLEYLNPLDRRFDAQPTACPRCGPRLALWDARGPVLAQCDEALRQAADMIRGGEIVAMKGLGGFQLLADARREAVTVRLRSRKCREEKPLALMFPSLEAVREVCSVSEMEERLLRSPEAPIVLLRRKPGSRLLAPSIAPNNPALGVMLPYTPLHHLLLAELGFPIVATSGNLSDEPMCIDEQEALERLHGIADWFLVHDRPIVRHVDDSIVRVVHGREMVLRRARGYAPLPIHCESPLPTILAFGAHLKNSVALSVGSEVFISQHIGDLSTVQAHHAFRKVAADLPRLYDAAPEAYACDLHPEYLSTKYAAGFRTPSHTVQHHWAHVVACAAENEIAPPLLGVSWDGSGFGLDGSIWGGEFLRAREDFASFERVAHLRPFRLPGGEAAIKAPRRAALGLLHEMWGADAFQRTELAPVRSLAAGDRKLIAQILAKEVRSPLTSSAGRLFDAVAALLGLRQRLSFEGQAAMELEYAIEPGVDAAYPFNLRDGSPCVVDWQPMIERIVGDLRRGECTGVMAAKFHNTLAEMIVAVAHEIGEAKVVLTGGCFQNQYLTERCIDRLTAEGFRPYWHQRVPPNDGGIALGQVVAAAAAMQGQVARESKAAVAV